MVTVSMLLPEHDVLVHEMLSTGWYQWADALRYELYSLKQRCDVVFIFWHSLGGALALHTAAHEEVAGIVAMCAPIHMHPLTHYPVRIGQYLRPLGRPIR